MILSKDEVSTITNGSYEEKIFRLAEATDKDILAVHEEYITFVDGHSIFRQSYTEEDNEVIFGDAELTDIVAYSSEGREAIAFKTLKGIVSQLMTNSVDEEMVCNQLRGIALSRILTRSPSEVLEEFSEETKTELFYDENREEIRGYLRGKVGEIEDSLKVVKLGRLSEAHLESYKVEIAESCALIFSRLNELTEMEVEGSFASAGRSTLAFVRETSTLRETAKLLTTLEDRLKKMYLVNTYNEMKAEG